MIFPRMSLHYKLVPIQYVEYESGLFIRLPLYRTSPFWECFPSDRFMNMFPNLLLIMHWHCYVSKKRRAPTFPGFVWPGGEGIWRLRLINFTPYGGVAGFKSRATPILKVRGVHRIFEGIKSGFGAYWVRAFINPQWKFQRYFLGLWARKNMKGDFWQLTDLLCITMLSLTSRIAFVFIAHCRNVRALGRVSYIEFL